MRWNVPFANRILFANCIKPLHELLQCRVELGIGPHLVLRRHAHMPHGGKLTQAATESADKSGRKSAVRIVLQVELLTQERRPLAQPQRDKVEEIARIVGEQRVLARLKAFGELNSPR